MIRTRRRVAGATRRVVTVLVGAALVAAAACGDDDDDDAAVEGTDGAVTTAAAPGTSAAPGTTAGAGTTPDAETATETTGGTGTTETAEEEPTTGGTFRFLGSTEPTSFDSARLLGNPFAEGDVPFAIYDSLVQFDADGEMVPRLAESVEPDDTFTVWTITLRDGVTFTDGTPFNAEAIKFNWDRMMAPETASPCRATIALGTYEVVDELTLEVTLAAPNSAYPVNLVACAGMIGSPTAIQANPEGFGTNPVGAGPFVLEEWTPGSQAVFTRNPDYWDAPKPYLDELVLRWLGNTTQRYQSFEADEADGVYFVNPTTEVTQLLDAGTKFVKPPLVGGQAQALNVTSPGLDDVRVRQALALATDPADIIAKTAAGAVEPSDGFFPEGSPWYSEDQPQQNVNDLEAAQALIDEYVAENGPVTIDMITAAPPRAANEVMQQQWSRLEGVTVNLEFIENPIPQMAAGEFDGVTIAASGRDPEVLKRFTTGFATNFGKYSNPEVDAQIQAGRETDDFAARQEAYNEALSIIFEEVPFIIYTPATQYTFLQDDVHLTQFGDGMWDFSSVWLED